jgi:hypothetical protein
MRIFPSPSRSEKLKKMSAAIPPSTPTVATTIESAAPTAISACSVASGTSVPPSHGLRSQKKKLLRRLAGLRVLKNSVKPSVSTPNPMRRVAPTPPANVPTSGPMIGNCCR